MPRQPAEGLREGRRSIARLKNRDERGRAANAQTWRLHVVVNAGRTESVAGAHRVSTTTGLGRGRIHQILRHITDRILVCRNYCHRLIDYLIGVVSYGGKGDCNQGGGWRLAADGSEGRDDAERPGAAGRRRQEVALPPPLRVSECRQSPDSIAMTHLRTIVRHAAPPVVMLRALVQFGRRRAASTPVPTAAPALMEAIDAAASDDRCRRVAAAAARDGDGRGGSGGAARPTVAAPYAPRAVSTARQARSCSTPQAVAADDASARKATHKEGQRGRGRDGRRGRWPPEGPPPSSSAAAAPPL